MRKLMCLLIGFVLSGLLSSPALALTPMGPPRARLKQKQHSLGFVIASSEMDLNVSGPGGSATMTDSKSKTYLARLATGVSDNLEFYTLLGFSDLSSEGFNGSSEFAWGVGSKFTVAEIDSVTLGGLCQILSMRSDGNYLEDVPGVGLVDFDIDVQIYDIQIAFGPTYTQKGLNIYGGPFLHFVDGDMDVSWWGDTRTVAIEQKSEFGGYVGVMYELAESSDVFIEYQKTGDANAIAGGLIWRF